MFNNDRIDALEIENANLRSDLRYLETVINLLIEKLELKKVFSFSYYHGHTLVGFEKIEKCKTCGKEK